MLLPTNLANSHTAPVSAIGAAHPRDGRLLTMGRPAVALGRRRFSTRGKVPNANGSKITSTKLSENNCQQQQQQQQQQHASSKAPLVGHEIHVQDPACSGNRCSDTSGITLPDFGSEDFALYDDDGDDYEAGDDVCRPCGSSILEEEEDPQLLPAPGLLRFQSTGTDSALPSMPRRRSSNVSLFSNGTSNLSSYQHSHSSSYLRRISQHSKSENDTLPQAPGRSMSTTNDMESALLASFGATCVIQEEELDETDAETEDSPTRVSCSAS